MVLGAEAWTTTHTLDQVHFQRDSLGFLPGQSTTLFQNGSSFSVLPFSAVLREDTFPSKELSSQGEVQMLLGFPCEGTGRLWLLLARGADAGHELAFYMPSIYNSGTID